MAEITDLIYVLKLKSDKWYVGRTKDLERRFVEHVAGKGSAWTQRFVPVDIAEVRQVTGPYDEDNVTKEYMRRYGVDNVRGGSYSTPKLTRGQTKVLANEIRHASGECLRCGEHGHFISECPMAAATPPKKRQKNAEVDSVAVPSTEETASTIASRVVPRKVRRAGPGKGRCSRCGRVGCFTRMCKAWKDVSGNVIKDQPTST